MTNRIRLRISTVALLACTFVAHVARPAAAGTRPFSAFEGLQGVIVYDLTEDEDGIIWLGTENGVWRCKSNSFELVPAPTGKGQPAIVPPGWGHGSISVVADGRGVLWIGTGGGVMGLDVDTLEPVLAPRPLDQRSVPRLRYLQPGRLYACAEDGLYEIISGEPDARLVPGSEGWRVEDAVHWNGSLWIAYADRLIEIADSGIVHHPEVPVQGRATRLFVDSYDQLWVGMRKKPGLLRREGNGWVRYGPEQGLHNEEINCIAEERRADGDATRTPRLWVGTEKGLFQLIDGRFVEIGYREGLGNTDVHAIAFDREGLAWIGTFGGGAYLLRSGEIVHYGEADGLLYPFVEFLQRRSDGTVLIGTLRGLYRYVPDTERTETVDAGLRARHIAADSAGNWWVDTGDGIRASNSPESIPIGTVVECMITSPAGELFVGGSEGLFVLRDRYFEKLELPSDAGTRVQSLVFDRTGTLFAGTDRGLAWKEGDEWQSMQLDRPIVALAETTGGTMCAGTTDSILMISPRERKELRRFEQTGRVHTIVVSPEKKHVWAGTDNGIVRVEENRLPRITMEDGLPSRDVRGLAFISESCLLVGTTNGVARVQVDRVRYTEIKPGIEIDLWSINGPQRQAGRDAVEADLSNQALIADIRAIGRRSAVGIEYQHRIVEREPEWSDWTRENRVRLPRLPAGSYTVAARGRNADGAVSDVATARLVIVPPYWATRGFIVSASGASLLGLGGVFWLLRKRREYRRQIEHSERRHRSLVESIRVIPWEADPEQGRFVYVGPQTRSLVGHAPDDWHRADFLPRQVPKEDLPALRKAITSTNGDAGPAVVEHRLRAASGEVRWFKNIVSPSDGSNGRRMLQGLMVDITAEKRMEATERAIREELESAVALRTSELEQANETLRSNIAERSRIETALRESEERFASAFHSSPVAMVLTRLRDSVCLDANDAFFAMTGYAREQVVNKPSVTTEMWIVPADRQRMIESLRATGRVASMESLFRRSDGESRHGRLTVSRIDLNGEHCIISIADDITDRKRAEEELVRTKQQLAMLIASSPAVTYSCGPAPAHPTTFIGENVRNLMGYEPDQFYADAAFWAKRIHPADTDAAAALYRKVEAGKPARAEYRCRHADGHYVWIRDELAPVRDDAGRITGSVGSFTDLSERKIAEREAERQRDLLQQVIDSNPCIVFVKDREGRYTLANKAAADSCGLSRDAILGRTDAEIISNPDEVRRFQEQDAQLFQEGRELTIQEEAFTTRTGEIRILQSIKRPLRDSRGLITHVLGVSTDITERKRMERELEEKQQLLRAIIDGASDHIFAKDLEGRYVLTNPADSALLGADIVGATDGELFPREQAERLREIDRRVIESRQSHSYEEVIRSPDGTEHTLLINKFPRFNHRGDVIGVLGIAHDISDRKRAEHALQLSNAELERRIAERTSALEETRAYLQQVLDTSPALIFEKDADCRMVFANRAFLDSYGLSESDVLGRRVGEFNVNVGDVESYECGDRRVLETGGQIETIERHSPAGDDLWYTVVKKPIRRANGELHILGMATNITALVRAERELRESLTRLELMARGASDGLWDGTIVPDLPWHSPDTPVYYSPRFKEILGFSEEEFPDKLGSWTALLHPEDAPHVMKALEDHLERRIPYEIEYRLKTRSGEYRWFVARGQAIWDEHGRPLRMAGSLNDISGRKEAEERLRRQAQVFDNMYDGVVLTDAENRIIGWNRGAERIFGYSEAEVLGKCPEMLNPPELGPELTRAFRRQLARDGRWSGLVPFIRKGGAAGTCEVVCVPMTDESGRIIGAVSVNRDVSERIENEKHREKLEDRLRQSQKMEAIGTLASGIAHDFGNLLAAIFTYADLAKGSLPRNHAAIRTLEKLEQTAREARDVTNSLLTFTHRGVTQKSPQNLCRIVRENLSLLSRLLPARVRLRQNLPEEDVWVLADAGQLQQLLMNVISNARDAMPDGGRATISIRRLDTPGTDSSPQQRIMLSVQDEGCGMSDTVRARAFEPFFTTKPRGEGSGLGLSIVMSIVEDMRGCVEIESRCGVGTTIQITLPTCEPMRIAAQEPVHDQPTVHITVIEANRHVRSIITSTLRTRGYDVSPFGSFSEAITSLGIARDKRQLMVIDLDQGAASTTELEEVIGKIPLNTPLIVLASTLALNMRRYGLERCYLLRKPFQMSELANTVERLLRTPGNAETPA